MIGQTHGLSLRDERGAQGEIRVRIAGIELDTEAFGSPHSRRGTFIDRLHLQMRVARTISIALAGTDSLDVIGDQADQTADPCGVLWHASGGQSNIKLAGIVIFCGALMWTPFVTPTTSLCEACGPVILRICGMAVGLPEEYGLSATCRKACSPNAAAHRVAPRRFRVQGNLPGQNDRHRCLTSTSRAW